MAKQIVQLYEGHHFKLTDEQVASIGEVLAAMKHEDGTPYEHLNAILAQVWECEDGVYCCCHAVPNAKARVIRDVLQHDHMVTVKIDQ